MNTLVKDIIDLGKALVWYSKRKLIFFAGKFEGLKNFIVDVLMYRRGIRQKIIWHTSMVGLAMIGIIASGMFGGTSLVSSSYPGIGGPDPRFADSFEPFPNGLVLEESQSTHTELSVKPRSETIEHKVEEGETLSGIAKKYGISVDTIKWANKLEDVDTVKPGDKIRILPVSGVEYTVRSGDTIASVAKKYQADAQAIVDFPFNDVPDDFTLKESQKLILPDGTPPEIKVAPKFRIQPQFLSQGPSSPAFSGPNGSVFVWPTQGIITQYFAWYHPGVDIANNAAPAIYASDGGVVIASGWDPTGYGNKVVINHGNGFDTLYAHLSNIYVTLGQTVSRGQVLGQMGSTGRSTGTHLHFEIHYKGPPLNPLGILK